MPDELVSVNYEMESVTTAAAVRHVLGLWLAATIGDISPKIRTARRETDKVLHRLGRPQTLPAAPGKPLP
jgi:hypothetical protein